MTIIVHMYVSGLCGLVNRSPVYVRVTCVLMMMLQDTELPRGYFEFEFRDSTAILPVDVTNTFCPLHSDIRGYLNTTAI